jgi:hypothetical protein
MLQEFHGKFLHLFATLYRMRHWQDGARDEVSAGARTLAMSENAAALFV